MSGAFETPAAMASHEQFGAAANGVNSPAASQSQMEHQMRMPYSTDGYMQVGSSSQPYQSIPGGLVEISHVAHSNDSKRRRGRPRKYAPDGSMSAVYMASPPQQPINLAMPLQQQQPQTFSPAVDESASASPTAKKVRGRPPGSKNKRQQKEALGSNGVGFIPYVLNVNAGEDVYSKIMAICQNGQKTVCILSANGTISTVTLRQVATSGGTATYEGRFEILSLSGSFMLSEVPGKKSRTGGLSVALSGQDGSVLGGSVAGLLVAASPVQVIVGSFLPDAAKKRAEANIGSSSVPFRGHTAGASSSHSRGTNSESSDGPASPLNMTPSAAFDNLPQGMSNMAWK